MTINPVSQIVSATNIVSIVRTFQKVNIVHILIKHHYRQLSKYFIKLKADIVSP